MKMIAQIIGWCVFLALTKSFSHAYAKFKLVDQKQTAFVGSCAEIKCTVTSYLDTEDAYWFWMKDAVYNDTKARKDWDATIIYSTNDAKRPVSLDFQKRVKYIGSDPSFWKTTSNIGPKPQCSILICNLTKNDNGNYSVRFVQSASDDKWKIAGDRWKTSDVNLTVIDNPCPITFVQKPPIPNKPDEIEVTCSTLSSCPLELQIEESTHPPSRPREIVQLKKNVLKFTANWQDDGKIYSCQTQNNNDPYVIQNITLNVEYAPKEIVAEIRSDQNIVEGQNVTLTCSAKGNPEPSFTWFKNNTNYTETVYSRAQTWQIPSIIDSQSGEYHCAANNKHGTRESNGLTIDVKYAPEVEVEKTPRASEVIEGDTIALKCNVKRSNPRPHLYEWHKDQSAIGGQADQYNKTVNPEDRGSYTCTATNIVDSRTSEPLDIIVKYKPRKTKISTNTSDNTVKVGGSITITCMTEAYPAPSIFSWYCHNKNKQAAPDTSLSTTNTLILMNVQRTDEAQYMCNATNSIGTGDYSMPMDLKVRYGPTNVVLSMDSEVKEGQLISITCTVESFPPSQLQLMTASTSGHQPSVMDRNNEGSNLLRYTFSVTSAHTGFYTCKAQNEDSSDSSTPRKLVVRYPPKDVKVHVRPDVTVNENTFLTLRCTANCYPKATSFTWMKMTDGKKEKMQDTQETITIKSVSASDSGGYSCEVSNEMGSGLSQEVEVKVKYAPKHAHIIKGAEQQDSDGTSFVMLTCKSQSYPEIKEYSWYKKDENVDIKVSQSQTFKVSSNYPGVYYCIAKNEINQKKSDPVNLFDRTYLTVLKFFFLALIILLLVFSLFFVYRHKRKKAIQQRTTNMSPYFDFLDWWNSTSLRNLRNDPITAEPFRSRDDLLPDQPCHPNAQRRQSQPDSTSASNINTVYSTVKPPAGNTGPSAQKPVKQQRGNTEDDSLNYASINFGNKQKKKQTKEEVNDVYAAVPKQKPPKKNGQEKHEDYENVNAVDQAKSPDPFNDDTDTSEDDVEINYSQVSFKAKPGHQRFNRDSSTSDEEETQYTDVKIK